MKSHRRILVSFLCAMILATCFALPNAALAEGPYTNTIADCFEFFATNLTIDDDAVVLEGYFFNFNEYAALSNIRELTMTVYDDDGQEICTGQFDSLSDSLANLQLGPGESSYQVFNFNDTYVDPYDYNLEDGFSAAFECKFSYQE